MEKNDKYRNEISIVLAGEAGQGIQTIELILTKLLKNVGYNVFATKEYMSRVRGGTNSTEIRVASHPVSCFVNRIDILFPFDKKSLDWLCARTSDKTMIVGDKKILAVDKEMIDIPFFELAKELGNALFANIIAVGFIAGLLNIEVEVMTKIISEFFGDKGQAMIENNARAGQAGWDLGQEKRKAQALTFDINRSEATAQETVLNGHQAVALGAIAGGCNFVSSYPMSPSTGVLTFLAKHAEKFGIIVEQAEDEISAINMGLGSWYAGGRALATTSGGGFALMTEGISLAGCIESPIVIHLAQRPGPATGLPTRTAQEDLDLALYAGHGEFPPRHLCPRQCPGCFSLCSEGL